MKIYNGIYKVGNNWDNVLWKLYKVPKYKYLCQCLEKMYENDQVSPSKKDLFKSLELTDYDDVKVVILGQDPYPGIGDANGLAFSYTGEDSIPSSLRNIFKALYNDYHKKRINTDLTDWAKQGVLLLNCILSIEKGGQELSHRGLGWEEVTDEIIKKLGERKEPIVFVLWGLEAMKKESIITNNGKRKRHKIIKSYHPSPQSAWRKNPNGTTFVTSQPFKTIDANLKLIDNSPIDWYLGDRVSMNPKVKKKTK